MLTYVLNSVKMIFQLILYSFSLFSFFVNFFFLCCNFLIPWLAIGIVLMIIATKFVKLRDPDREIIDELLACNAKQEENQDVPSCLEFAIANKGGVFDVPENSIAALKQCLEKNCRNVLLDLSLTKCNKLVILNKQTLEKAGIQEPIQQLTLDSLKEFNPVENHALAQQFQSEKILTLDELLEINVKMHLKLYLLTTNCSNKMLEALKEAIRKHEKFVKQVVLVTTSPFIVYQLRKQFPNLICGLWMDKTTLAKNSYLFKTSAILMAIYMAIFRNIISPVIGIKVVIIHKDEFNAHISALWRSVGIRPIVYTVNSPNEKRYFQQVVKTQYLTDSLRSEPQVIFKAKIR
ncbi:glycerophosphodiester phosphodiesterase 1 [Culicoides brevitarsis]|uniref:glycerophosphodiester phosphodiesterase 1 n=1 Tax=Culicoides brevitarsis TaxID=469753 RepID=UPI00307B16C6